MFAKGSRVEVAPADEGFDGAWYVATVAGIVKQKKTIKYLVRYDTLFEEEGSTAPLMEAVDDYSVRPSPPPSAPATEFQVNDIVDAYHRDGWWTGVVTNVFSERDMKRYSVFFKTPPEEFQFEISQLRPHLDWIDGLGWLPMTAEQATSHRQASKLNSDAHSMKPTVCGLSAKDKNPSSGKRSVFNGKSAKAVVVPFNVCGNKRGMDSVETSSRAKRPQRSAGKNVSAKDLESEIEPPAVNSDQQGSKNQQEKKRGGSDGLPSGLLQASQEHGNTNCSEPQRKDTEMPITEASTDFDEQPLSTWYQRLHPLSSRGGSPASANKSNTSPVAQTPEVHQNQELPFVVSSPIWSTLRSSELFQTVPQNPHFSPLQKLKEDFREGVAIGHMVTFTKVVERASKLGLSDKEAEIRSILETLAELESHGFNVDAVQARLNDLLERKAQVERLEDERRVVETELEKRSTEWLAVEVEIRELEEKLGEAVKAKENMEKEIETLKAKVVRLVEAKDAAATAVPW